MEPRILNLKIEHVQHCKMRWLIIKEEQEQYISMSLQVSFAYPQEKPRGWSFLDYLMPSR